MKLYIGSDHAGYKLKETIKKYLDEQKVSYVDLGNQEYDPDDDYPDFSYKVANKIYYEPGARGILFCGSAVGACITANKVKGIRAASVRSVGEAKLAVEDDDVNVICLAGGQQVQKKVRGIGIPDALAKKIVKAWLDARFSKAKRHQRRIDKIKSIERKNFA